MIVQTITVALGFITQAATDVIHRHTSIISPQLLDQTVPVERPCRITVHHQQRATVTFVNVMVAMTHGVGRVFDLDGPVFERIQSPPGLLHRCPLNPSLFSLLVVQIKS